MEFSSVVILELYATADTLQCKILKIKFILPPPPPPGAKLSQTLQ